MKIQVASDLHLEFLAGRFPAYRAIDVTDAEVLVLAGDIHRHAMAVAAFRDWPCPVVLLHGNHELYNSSVESTLAALAAAAPNAGMVRYLEKSEWRYQGVRFLGCCLWTDYALYGDPQGAMRIARSVLMDHHVIRVGARAFMPADALAAHMEARAWLESQLALPFDGPTVVCTHHGPNLKSIHPSYENDPVNPCFISDLSELMEKADVWVHGHVHNSFDYTEGRTRVVANPRGYALNLHCAARLEDIAWENKAFQPGLVIEV